MALVISMEKELNVDVKFAMKIARNVLRDCINILMKITKITVFSEGVQKATLELKLIKKWFVKKLLLKIEELKFKTERLKQLNKKFIILENLLF